MENTLPPLVPVGSSYPRNRAFAPSPELTVASTRRADEYRAAHAAPNAKTLSRMITAHSENALYSKNGATGALHTSIYYIEDAASHELAHELTCFIRVLGQDYVPTGEFRLFSYSTDAVYGGNTAMYTVDRVYVPGHMKSGTIVFRRTDY